MLRLALRLYRTDPSFRGFTDFAAFGSLALVCLNPPAWPSVPAWSSALPFLQPTAPTAQGPSTIAPKPSPATASAPPGPSPSSPSSPPRRHPFDDVNAALTDNLRLSHGTARWELYKAVDALRSQRLDDARQILAPLDDNDPNVQIFRALVLARKGDRKAGAAGLAAPATAGHSLAAFLLGEEYRTGANGIAQDKAHTFELWKSACDTGLSMACSGLASAFYAGGELGWRDDAKAREIFASLASRNHPASVNWLGVFAATGRGGMARDDAAAAGYFRRAADLGNPVAMRNYYLQLRSGRGTDRNIDEALMWLRRSADTGDLVSQRLLGQFLAKGEGGTTPDPVRGAALLRQAALSNDGPAQEALGDLYDQGRGLPHDSMQAYVFYGLANFHGVATAQAKMTALQARMGNDERERAERLLSAALPSRLAPQDATKP